MTVRVRPARPADHPAVAALSVAAYLADGQLSAPTGGYGDRLADVGDRAARGALLVAEDTTTGEVIGSVTFVLPGSPYAELCGPGEAEFRMLAVHPAAQGRGVGAALARACLDRAGELGCRAVVICTRDFAEPAARLYRRLGFTRVPELDCSHGPDVRLLGWRVDLPVRCAAG